MNLRLGNEINTACLVLAVRYYAQQEMRIKKVACCMDGYNADKRTRFDRINLLILSWLEVLNGAWSTRR